MGQGRGGLYGYDWLENLLGLRMHSADIVTDLASAGYVVKTKEGRRNRYTIQSHLLDSGTRRPLYLWS